MNKIILVSQLTSMVLKHPIKAMRSINKENFNKLIHAMKYKRSSLVLDIATAHLNATSLAKNKVTKKNKKIEELESKYPGITKPNAIYNTYLIEDKITPIPYQLSSTEPVRVNVLLPQLDPLIMFGGYISCLQFVRKLIQQGHNVRILICESDQYDQNAVSEKLKHNPELSAAISKCEVACVLSRKEKLIITENDSFIAYSFWMGILAHQLASAVGKKFIFFIQEYESIFHSYDSCYAIADYVYKLPHYAIFNTTILRDFFKTKKMSVFGHDDGDSNSVCYQHALTKTTCPTVQQLSDRTKRRFIFYARPEDHAKRNLFEIAFMGLKLAVLDGAFDNADWDFVGVGTLGTEHDLPIGKGMTLNMTSTLPQADYGYALSGFDLGLSLMLAPHPSIAPFEMATAGVVTITNVYENRDFDVLTSISKNIVPCETDMFSVADSIKHAVSHLVNDSEYRVANASVDWVTDWDDAFNKDVMAKVNDFLGVK
ncbi:hypothetical protein KAR91_00270 [Candidatus Pacearchaeota archaeon]|nr:hypothetical protein [Candidatus Pacearchaeota archaeon]